MHFGLGWGQLSGTNNKIKNPFGYINETFNDRPEGYAEMGGQFNVSKYFSGREAAPFYGISYALINKLMLQIEKDTTLNDDGLIEYKKRSSDFSYGIDYSINNNFSIGASFERGNFFSLRFVYKNNPKQTIKKYEYKKPVVNKNDNKYTKLIKNLENNGIGVEKITETSKTLGLNLTQFIHSDIKLVEEIISKASTDAGIKKNIKKDIKIADLKAIEEIDKSFLRNSKLIYERNETSKFDSNTGIKFRPFIASREEFFKGALLVENDSEFIIRENLFFNTNLKYTLADNFDDLRFPPIDVYPAQVRSDVKEYLKNMDGGILIGRAQLDYHLTPRKNNHLMFTAGILEDMFSGYGFEYLYFQENKNYSFGFEIFNARKRL